MKRNSAFDSQTQGGDFSCLWIMTFFSLLSPLLPLNNTPFGCCHAVLSLFHLLCHSPVSVKLEERLGCESIFYPVYLDKTFKRLDSIWSWCRLIMEIISTVHIQIPLWRGERELACLIKWKLCFGYGWGRKSKNARPVSILNSLSFILFQLFLCLFSSSAPFFSSLFSSSFLCSYSGTLTILYWWVYVCAHACLCLCICLSMAKFLRRKNSSEGIYFSFWFEGMQSTLARKNGAGSLTTVKF